MIEGIILGLQNVFVPFNFALLALGVFLGVFFGALPGLTGPMAIALFIPITFGMRVTPALLFLSGIYSGSVFGGSITAILLKIPGDTGNAATVFDGYSMAQSGAPGKALGYSILSSTFGGIFSGIILICLAPFLARVALKFGPAEYFAIAFLGLSAITSLGGGNQLRSIMACIFGLLLACVGSDEISGNMRITFGTFFLMDGIQFVPTMIGFFAFSEIFEQITLQSKSGDMVIKSASTKLPTFREMWIHKWLVLKSSIIGTWVGILPGTGATVASFLAYSEAARSSKHPEQFGTGIPEGIIAPETANNAAVGGSFVPTLALGIPGSGAATLLISALMLHGIRPGPMIFTTQTGMVFSVMVGFFISNIIFLVMGVFGTRHFGKLLQVPYFLLLPVIILLTIIGSFALRNNPGDIILMFVAGVMAYFLVKKAGFPIAPIILGLVLGSIMEHNFRRAFLIAGSIRGIFTRPITGVIILISITFLLYPTYRYFRKKFKDKKLASEA